MNIIEFLILFMILITYHVEENFVSTVFQNMLFFAHFRKCSPLTERYRGWIKCKRRNIGSRQFMSITDHLETSLRQRTKIW